MIKRCVSTNLTAIKNFDGRDFIGISIDLESKFFFLKKNNKKIREIKTYNIFTHFINMWEIDSLNVHDNYMFIFF
jgi:hypothetical protein